MQEHQQSYFSQLQTIKAIENNLTQLKSRINFLQKQETRSAHHFQKLLQSSIPIIRRKMNQSETENKNKGLQCQKDRIKNQKLREVSLSKKSHEVSMSRSKVQLKKQKNYGSFHIREMSKKNKNIIESAKRQLIESKKRKTELVRTHKMQSRRKIQQFHNKKQQQLQRLKQQQKEQLKVRINKITQQLVAMMEVEEMECQKYERKQNNVRNLKQILYSIKNMKHQQFQVIMDRLELSTTSSLDDNTLGKILSEVNKNTSNKERQEPDQTFSLHEQTSQIRRYDSESTDIQTIYKNKNRLKKLR